MRCQVARMQLAAGGAVRPAAFTARRPSLRPQRMAAPQVTCMAGASLEFIKGVQELTIPDIKLTRSRDGASGVATFTFQNPAVFEASSDLGDITGLYMTDEEGTINTVEVQAKFVNGKPDSIECKYIMRSQFEWDRLLRFLERLAEEQGLEFRKAT